MADVPPSCPVEVIPPGQARVATDRAKVMNTIQNFMIMISPTYDLLVVELKNRQREVYQVPASGQWIKKQIPAATRRV